MTLSPCWLQSRRGVSTRIRHPLILVLVEVKVLAMKNFSCAKGSEWGQLICGHWWNLRSSLLAYFSSSGFGMKFGGVPKILTFSISISSKPPRTFVQPDLHSLCFQLYHLLLLVKVFYFRPEYKEMPLRYNYSLSLCEVWSMIIFMASQWGANNLTWLCFGVKFWHAFPWGFLLRRNVAGIQRELVGTGLIVEAG